MAIARLSVGTGKKGKASPHAQYIAREGKYAKDNNSLEKLEHTGHGNMPAWAEHNPNYFWQSADEHERKNGSTYREHVIALPRELSSDQRHDLIKDWIDQEIGDKHAYQYAIHNPPAMDGKEQPHAHIMFSERTRDGIERDPDQYFKRYNSKNPERGGAKKANTGMKPADRKADLLAQRDRWEKTCNAHLEQAGRYERISMKSLKAQGIEREPTNFTMTQLKKPEIKDTYKSLLEAKEQDFQAKLDIITVLEGTALVEINRQIRLKEEGKKAQQEKVQERTQKPVERQKTPQATTIAPTIKPKPTEPQATTQKDADAIALRVDEAMKNIKEVAGNIQKQELSRLVKIGKPLLNKYDELKANKPMLLGRKQWEKDVNQALKDYNQVKGQYNQIKADGITAALREKAIGIIYKDNPDDFFKLKAEAKQANEYEKKNEVRERLKSTSEIAKDGRQYTGKIVTISEHGIIQQTPTGKRIYHDPEKINIGSHVKGDTVKVIYENDKGRVQQAEREHSKQRDLRFER